MCWNVFLLNLSATLGKLFSPDNISLILFPFNTHPPQTKGLKLNLCLLRQLPVLMMVSIIQDASSLIYPRWTENHCCEGQNVSLFAPLFFLNSSPFILAVFPSRKTFFWSIGSCGFHVYYHQLVREVVQWRILWVCGRLFCHRQTEYLNK